ncbi:hypothetical protein NECAME_15856 [Necator americanus]|uniref:Uncharacterized protein n=1 Tax=Necator americanus TaxID=51031 RepID=W2SFT4_NECAM|nr:hypothetical protein NECAME_15856 [Necator americanus]ETN68388.1 hypothetical protein NECAME_15856 [Necator americanus]
MPGFAKADAQNTNMTSKPSTTVDIFADTTHSYMSAAYLDERHIAALEKLVAEADEVEDVGPLRVVPIYVTIFITSVNRLVEDRERLHATVINKHETARVQKPVQKNHLPKKSAGLVSA